MKFKTYMEIEVEVDVEYDPAEAPTHIYPGCEDSIQWSIDTAALVKAAEAGIDEDELLEQAREQYYPEPDEDAAYENWKDQQLAREAT